MYAREKVHDACHVPQPAAKQLFAGHPSKFKRVIDSI
jgi:hypothetical protein